MFFIFSLLNSLCLPIDGFDTTLRNEETTNENYFVLNIITMEEVHRVSVVKLNEDQKETIYEVPIENISVLKQNSNNDFEEFSYKITIHVEKEEFVDNKHEIVIYGKNDTVLFIASDLIFNLNSPKLLHAVFYSPTLITTEYKDPVIFDSKIKTVKQDQENLKIFALRTKKTSTLFSNIFFNKKNRLSTFLKVFRDYYKEQVIEESRLESLTKLLVKDKSKILAEEKKIEEIKNKTPFNSSDNLKCTNNNLKSLQNVLYRLTKKIETSTDKIKDLNKKTKLELQKLENAISIYLNDKINRFKRLITKYENTNEYNGECDYFESQLNEDSADDRVQIENFSNDTDDCLQIENSSKYTLEEINISKKSEHASNEERFVTFGIPDNSETTNSKIITVDQERSNIFQVRGFAYVGGLLCGVAILSSVMFIRIKYYS